MGMWHKLRSASVNSSFQTSPGGSMARSNATVNVEEEYNQALRTNSFVDLWSKSHHHPKRSVSSSPSPPPPPLSAKFHLDPSQDSLLSAASGLRAAALLLDFFDATLDASNACISLLDSIALARNHHRSISILLLRLLSPNNNNNNNNSSTRAAAAFADLARRIDLENPLSPSNLSLFHRAHSRYPPLVVTLTAAHKKILRRARFIRIAKKASRFILIGACGAAIAAALVLAIHAMLAFGVAAVLAAARPRPRRKAKEGGYERAGFQVDAAAKGAYIVERDLDTMSRMVRRAHDEIEHGRDVARIVLRSGGGEVREVAKEVEEGEVELEEQLEELEEHVCLCLVTINRSRRLVATEMMRG